MKLKQIARRAAPYVLAGTFFGGSVYNMESGRERLRSFNAEPTCKEYMQAKAEYEESNFRLSALRQQAHQSRVEESPIKYYWSSVQTTLGLFGVVASVTIGMLSLPMVLSSLGSRKDEKSK